MLLPALAFLLPLTSRQDAQVLTLTRGSSLYGCPGIGNYQDVEDTSLEKLHPDALHGGDYTLVGGPDRTILIRFGSLPAALGPNVKVLDAKLVLTMTSADKPALHAISSVTKPWGEGPFQLLPLPPKPGAVPPKVSPDKFGATWRSRYLGLGESTWFTAGAQSDQDASPIAGAAGAADGTTYTIAGLGPAVQKMVSDPGSNNGFALTFDTTPEFVSSEAAEGKPALLITYQTEKPQAGADVAIVSLDPQGDHWDATLTNVGAATSSGARGEAWLEGGVPAPVNLPASIEPGKTIQVPISLRSTFSGPDGRVGELTLRVDGAPNDHNRADKQLTVSASATPLAVSVLQDSLAEVSSLRGPGIENWLQSQVEIINNIYLARSRYSFAPSGCYARVRIAHEVAPKSESTSDLSVSVTLDSRLPLVDLSFVRNVLLKLGAPDWSKTDLPRTQPAVAALGCNVNGSGPFPDITGGGDTRYEGGLPSQVILPQVAATITDAVLEPSGLLSASAVALLNTARAEGKNPASLPFKLPTTIFIDASDATGRPLKNAELQFFQLHGTSFGTTPAFTLQTTESGSAALPKRPVAGALPNPFGSKDLVADGSFAVKVTANGESAWSWLRAWQLTDAVFRGDTAFASLPLQFNLPNASVDRTQNLALNRAISDSAGSFPAKLASLVDGTGQTGVALPQTPGSWVEIDLNRDWTLSELRLTADGAPWDAFQIEVYQTGQKASQAFTWASEPDWKWSAANHGEAVSPAQTSLSYHGAAVQIRYIRVKCVKPGSGKLLKIEAFSPKAST